MQVVFRTGGGVVNPEVFPSVTERTPETPDIKQEAGRGAKSPVPTGNPVVPVLVP